MSPYKIEDLPPEIAARIVVNPETGCWEWQHGLLGSAPDRYGQTMWDGRQQPIHRVVYKLLAGAIPDGHDLDHVYDWGCRAHSCCWPAHLEPVTRAENSRRRNVSRAKRVREITSDAGRESAIEAARRSAVLAWIAELEREQLGGPAPAA